MSIYVRDKDGNQKKIAGTGLPGPVGKSAYQYAVEGGFTGTEAEFAALVGVRSNPNLLDNWYFLDPINQRGQAEYTENGYAIDRWSILGDGTHTLTVNENGCSFTGSGSDNLFQLTEANICGKTVTLSVLLENVVGEVRLRFRHFNWNFGDEVKCVNGLNSLTVKVPDEYENFRCTLSKDDSPDNGTFGFKILAAKLELGPVQTLAHKEGDTWVLNDPPPNKALELAKCQRYQLVVPGDATAYAVAGLGATYFNQLRRVQIDIPTPVPMRAKPAITATGHWFIRGGGNSLDFNFSTTSPGIYQYSFNYVAIDFSVPEGSPIPDNFAVEMIRGDNSTAQMIFDANL